ncbi:MAG: tetratricopeptide repeat protein [Trichocoleus desertorum ATA4-8-CV12]|jgi:tetratricopeptide (TPR) repeat protein|nr:tetratricopeptide repeat protein [Trichocoleus desertorum ATA4-8-CV12]
MRPQQIALLVSLLAFFPAGLLLPLPLLPFSSLSALAQTLESRDAEANRLLQQGFQQYGKSQYQEAIKSWQQALAIYRAASDRNGEADALNNLGGAYGFLSQYQRAIEYYEQALPIFQQVRDRSGEGLTLHHLVVRHDDYDRLGVG